VVPFLLASARHTGVAKIEQRPKALDLRRCRMGQFQYLLPLVVVETEGVRVKGIPDVIDIHLEGSFASREEGRTQDSS
jgi:hypothetical protein